MLSIIDGDTLVYKAAGAAQKRNKETKEIELEPVVNAYANAKHMMMEILKNTGCSDYRLILTESPNKECFRTKLYPEYKANRKGKEKPVYFNDVREYYINNWDAEIAGKGLEADDVVCMLQYQNDKFSTDKETVTTYLDTLIKVGDFGSVLCGIDKDLNQIPGLHYNYDTKEFKYIVPIDGLRSLYLQMLTGDAADNIPRIKKGWRQKEAELKISVCKDEFELYSIVFDEICKVRYNVGDLGLIDSRQEEEINKEIKWRGDLLYLKHNIDDEYKVPE